MSIVIEHNRKGYLVCRASGTLTKADYDAALPEFENALALRDGPVRVLIALEDFRGWEIGALWEELKFDVRHLDDFGRVAIVGDTKWEEWGIKLSKPFFSAEMRYFDLDHKDEAERWLDEGVTVS